MLYSHISDLSLPSEIVLMIIQSLECEPGLFEKLMRISKVGTTHASIHYWFNSFLAQKTCRMPLNIVYHCKIFVINYCHASLLLITRITSIVFIATRDYVDLWRLEYEAGITAANRTSI